MASARWCWIAAVMLAGALAGCAGSGGIRIVSESHELAAGAELLDVHTFRIEGTDEGRMRQVAREWARQMGADAVAIRVVQRSADQLLFAVEAYRSPAHQ
jgi:hypothetical protein